MPAVTDDPTAPAIYRVSGEPPFPVPFGPLPHEVEPKQVTLRDRITTATLVPFSSPAQVPARLMAYLCELLNREIEKGDTYAMMDPIAFSSFGPYWFANFAAVMVMGEVSDPSDIMVMEGQGTDWTRKCLGSFYIKPNYPGRSSHVCTGIFLVTDAARNRGVGRLMGEAYLDWAPKLGYSYSVFNLVYDTNVASLRIWDALGFKRIGRVKGCGNLKSHPDQLIDAIIFGRELGGDGDEYVSEERFDKIKFYLKNGTYPAGADRAEKSRLRSAATHYRLHVGDEENGEGDKLMLKGKEVISDPHKQYEIARNTHSDGHGGINKTTATIAERYHWIRIKETVSLAIRNCSECKDSAASKESTTSRRKRKRESQSSAISPARKKSARRLKIERPDSQLQAEAEAVLQQQQHHHQLVAASRSHGQFSRGAMTNHIPQPAPTAPMQIPQSRAPGGYLDLPLDPQIMHWGDGGQGGAGGVPGRGVLQNGIVPNGSTVVNDDDDEEEDDEEDDDDDMTIRLRESLEAQLMQDHHDEFLRRQMRASVAGR